MWTHDQVDEMLAQFPHPVALGDMEDSTDYCTGGIPFLFSGLHNHWPCPERLANLLQDQNPRLPASTALEHARRIIEANDAHAFDTARRRLRVALTAPYHHRSEANRAS